MVQQRNQRAGPETPFRRSKGVSKMLYRFKGCVKCGGDLASDCDEWSCFQCGRIYYPQRSPMEPLLEPMKAQHPLSTDVSPGEVGPHRRRRKARRINAVIAAKRRSDEKWRSTNQQVIRHLDQGKSVREISEVLGRNPRQIRGIRERLYDLRATALDPVAVD